MRATKNKRNWNQLFALYMPDPELLSLLNQKHLNIKKNYKSLPILKREANNRCRKFMKENTND